MDLLKQCKELLPPETLQQQLHVSPMPARLMQWHDRILAGLSKIIQNLWNESLTDWFFLIHLSGRRNHYLLVYDTTVVAANLIYGKYMLWNFYSHSCYQAVMEKDIK